MLGCRHFAILLAFCPGAAAQADPPAAPAALQWATGQASRFEQYTNPVVSAHALASLAALVCEHDRSAGVVLFRKALARIDNTPDSFFVDEKAPVLPISSFTALWKMVIAPALKCDPALATVVDVERVQTRLTLERQQANFTVLAKAYSRIAADPERAAQLADLVLTAGEVEMLDFPGFGLFLSHLRERAPELGDRVFIKAADAVASARVPNTRALDELGKYLFVDPQLRESPDEFNYFRDVQVQSSTVTDFRSVRYSTNPEPVEAYIRTILRMVEKPGFDANYDATVAYSVAFQTEVHARRMGLETRDLAGTLTRIATSAGLQVASALGSPVADARPAGADRSRAVGQVLTAVRGKRFVEARQLLARVDDQDTRGQVAVLIDFGEASAAIAAGDLVEAARLTNGVRSGGLKRGLLYAGLVAAGDRKQISQGIADATVLPAEFRAALLLAIADGLVESDPQRMFSILRNIVEASNAARTSPLQGRFDPRQVRGPGRQGVGAATDVPFIPLSSSRFYEVVDTNGSRHAFDLGVPKVNVFTLPGLLLRTEKLDYRLLEATVLGLRGEMQQAAALLAIVESRLKVGATPNAEEKPR